MNGDCPYMSRYKPGDFVKKSDLAIREGLDCLSEHTIYKIEKWDQEVKGGGTYKGLPAKEVYILAGGVKVNEVWIQSARTIKDVLETIQNGPKN